MYRRSDAKITAPTVVPSASAFTRAASHTSSGTRRVRTGVPLLGMLRDRASARVGERGRLQTAAFACQRAEVVGRPFRHVFGRHGCHGLVVESVPGVDGGAASAAGRSARECLTDQVDHVGVEYGRQCRCHGCITYPVYYTCQGERVS